MNRYFAVTLLIALIGTTASAETVNTRYGKLNIHFDNNKFEATISVNNKIIKKTEMSDSPVLHGPYHLGKTDIIALTEGSATGITPQFQYLIAVKPRGKTQFYMYPEESLKATYKITDGKFYATYDKNLVEYNGKSFRSIKIRPDLSRNTSSRLPLKLCKSVYNIRADIIDTYHENGRLDVFDFAQYAHQTVRELTDNYPWFSPGKMAALGGKHDKYLEKVSFDKFKNTVCVNTSK